MNSWSDDSDYTPCPNRLEFDLNLNDSDSNTYHDFSDDSSDSISLPTGSYEFTSNLSDSDSNDIVINNNVENSYIINEDHVLDDLPHLHSNMNGGHTMITNNNSNDSFFIPDIDLYYTYLFDSANTKSAYSPNMDENVKNNSSVLTPKTDLVSGLSFLGNDKPEIRANSSTCAIPTEIVVVTSTPSMKAKPRKRGKKVTEAAKKVIFKLYRELRKKDPSKHIKIIAKEIRMLLPIRYPYDISCNS